MRSIGVTLSCAFALALGACGSDSGEDGSSSGGSSGSSGASGSSGSGAAGGSGGSTGGAQSFEQRCAAPEVIACFGFDTPETTTPYLNDSGFSPPEHDTSTYAEGGGAIRMQVLPGSGPDTSGSAVLDFSPGIGTGETLYVQWRQRFSAAFVATEFDALGFKQILVHENTSTAGCSDSEIVVNDRSGWGFPNIYHACGVFQDTIENPVDGDVYEFNYQPGGDNRCLYSWITGDLDYLEPSDDVAETACIGYEPDIWITFQIAVHLNAWCTNADYDACPEDNRLEMWITNGASPPIHVIDTPFALRTTTDPASTVYDSIQLTPYNTDKNPAQQHEPGELWYDSVIVSRARIAEPE
jgi:hypothetical protein